MTYYEHHDDHDGAPLPEWLIDQGFSGDGALAFQERMFLISEVVADTRQMLGGVPFVIRERIATRWATDDEDLGALLEEIESCITLWDAIDNMIQQDKE